MTRLFTWISILFTPRRSFAYRQLEEQLKRVEAERDDYRDRWIKSVEHALVTSGKPKFSIVDQRSEPVEPVKRLSRAEIEAQKKEQADREFEDWLLAHPDEKRHVNDVDYLT